MASLNVLVTAGSRRVGLVSAFQRALRELRLGGSVIVTDVNALSPAVHLADQAFEVSLSTSPGYLDEIAGICERHDVGLIVPTIDEELPLFGEAIDRFASMGVTVFTSRRPTAECCNDKFAACAILQQHGIAAADSYLPDALPPDPSFPMFVKPRFGRGSIGSFAVRDRRELAFFLDYVEEPVVQSYLEGREFTIDLLCDLDGRPLSVVPRERLVIRAGVSDRGRTVLDRSLIDLALACADVFEFRGAANIQCRLQGSRPVVFEINPRFSGGIPLTIAAGADFPRQMIELTLGRRVAPSIGTFAAGLFMTSYESSLFLERGRLNMVPARTQHAIREAV